MHSYVPPPSFQGGRYVPNKVLGTGTYGQVLRCYDTQRGSQVAIKVAQRESAYRRSALNEIDALQHLQGTPDTVHILDSFEDNGHICIVSELLSKTLYDILRSRNYGPLSIDEVREAAEHLLGGLASLHHAGYIHCDLKPENIMIRQPPSASLGGVDRSLNGRGTGLAPCGSTGSSSQQSEGESGGSSDPSNRSTTTHVNERAGEAVRGPGLRTSLWHPLYASGDSVDALAQCQRANPNHNKNSSLAANGRAAVEADQRTATMYGYTTGCGYEAGDAFASSNQLSTGGNSVNFANAPNFPAVGGGENQKYLGVGQHHPFTGSYTNHNNNNNSNIHINKNNAGGIEAGHERQDHYLASPPATHRTTFPSLQGHEEKKSRLYECTCLIDFGAVRRFHDNAYYDVQSLWYRAPEVLCGLPYTTAIDAWSMGCVLFELYTGKPFFPGDNKKDQLSRIVQMVGYPSPMAMTMGTLVGEYAFPPVCPSEQERRLRAQDYVRQCRAAGVARGLTHAQKAAASASSLSGCSSPVEQGYEGHPSRRSPPFTDVMGQVPEGWVHPNDLSPRAAAHVAAEEGELIDLILALLHPDESRRLSCTQALAHPFLKNAARSCEPTPAPFAGPATSPLSYSPVVCALPYSPVAVGVPPYATAVFPPPPAFYNPASYPLASMGASSLPATVQLSPGQQALLYHAGVPLHPPPPSGLSPTASSPSGFAVFAYAPGGGPPCCPTMISP